MNKIRLLFSIPLAALFLAASLSDGRSAPVDGGSEEIGSFPRSIDEMVALAKREGWLDRRLSPEEANGLARLVRDHGLEPVDRGSEGIAAGGDVGFAIATAFRIRFGTDHMRSIPMEGDDQDQETSWSQWANTLVGGLRDGSRPANSVVEDAEPKNRIYQSLLDHFRKLTTNESGRSETWRDLEAPGGDGLIHAGEKYEQTPLLQQRLAGAGYLPTPAGDPENPELFTEEMAEGLRRFQRDFHLADDGILGPDTLEILNRSPEDRRRLVRINLDRARQLPDELGARHLFVNLPGGRLEAWNDGRSDLRMPVVFGADSEDRRTPVFAGMVETVVFRPYWNVPESIASGEIVPETRKNPSQFRAKNYQIVREFGSDDQLPLNSETLAALSSGELKVRQAPGSSNSLGLVKFLFPNQHHVYLHDTPQDQLFDRTQRDFSHGCVRVERPAELANWILGSQGWDRERVDEALREGGNRAVAIEAPFPVYIVYFTVWLDGENEGRITFFPDVYDRDESGGEKLTAK